MYSVKSSISESGIGLFSGEYIQLTLSPSFQHGIWFKNKNGYISELTLENISVDYHNTSITFSDGSSIKIIEHLLAAIYAFGISDVLISLSGDEVPIFDGSSSSYIFLLQQLFLEKTENIFFAKLNKKIEVSDGDFFIKAKPSSQLIVDSTIEFKNTPIGKQKYKLNFSKEAFLRDISSARTFGVVPDLNIAQQLYKGATLQNTLIISNGKLLSEERVENEFVKHKILDAIGDLRTFKYPLLMNYKSFGSSHKLNNLLLKKIVKEKAFDLVEITSPISILEETFEYSYALA